MITITIFLRLHGFFFPYYQFCVFSPFLYVSENLLFLHNTLELSSLMA